MKQALLTQSRILFLMSGALMGAAFVPLLQNPIAAAIAILVLGVLLLGWWLDMIVLSDPAEAIIGAVRHSIALIGRQLSVLPMPGRPSLCDKNFFWLGFSAAISALWLLQLMSGSGA